MKKKLDEIAIECNTDKSSISHNYTESYENHFEKIRFNNLKVLEIGIQNGFSLKMWKEYFENSTIVGIDLTDLSHLKEDRVEIEVGNQSDEYFLRKVSERHGPFDIIIDDGSHKSVDIRKSFYCLFPLLKSGGYYAIEDLHTNYWEKNNITEGWFIDENHDVFVNDIKKFIDYSNSNGKSGYANRALDDTHAFQEMDYWEKNIHSVHSYRSICFVKKC
jgi:hypothetical protein